MEMPATQNRALAALFAASAFALVVLLAAHPGGHPHTFAEFIELELQTQLAGQLVHGGAVVVLMVLLAGHIAVARMLRPLLLAPIIAVVFFGAGCALLTGSLVMDGFAVPALAQLFQAAKEPPAQQGVRSLIQFAGTLIGVLMPLGLTAFSLSALAWAWPLATLRGRHRVVGLAVGAIGLGSIALLAATPATGRELALMVSLVLLALWQVGFVVALTGRTSDARTPGVAADAPSSPGKA